MDPSGPGSWSPSLASPPCCFPPDCEVNALSPRSLQPTCRPFRLPGVGSTPFCAGRSHGGAAPGTYRHEGSPSVLGREACGGTRLAVSGPHVRTASGGETVSERFLAPLSPETRQALSAVISAPIGPRVSLYLPAAPPPNAGQNDVLRRQALDAVRKRLEALGVKSPDAARRCEQLDASLLDPAHRAPPRGTLVAFASGSEVRCVPLAQHLPFLVSVGKRLVLRPVLRALQIEGPYWVLSLTTKQVALFEGDARGLRRAEQGALQIGR